MLIEFFIIRWLKSHKIRCPEIVDLYIDTAGRSPDTEGLQPLHVLKCLEMFQ